MKDPLRILVVTSTFPRWAGDTEPPFIFNLCKYLQQHDVDVDVIAPHAPGAKKHEILDNITVYRYRYFFSHMETLAYAGGIMANLKKSSMNYLLIPFLLFFQLIAVLRRLTSGNYHLIHAHWLVPQGVICCLVRKILGQKKHPLLCTSHGSDLYSLDTPVFRFLKKWTIMNSSCLTVVSNAMKNYAGVLCNNRQDIRVIPMGIDLKNTFVPVPGIARKDRRLLFVGRLVENKGVNILIEAMDLIRRKLPDVELLIIGDGPMRAYLENETRKLGLEQYISFRGALVHEQLPELYSSSAVAVVPSIDQEGLGLAVIEALGCGCAVVASDLPAIREILDSETGILVKPADVPDLAEKLITVLLDRKLQMQLSANGRKRVTSKFDIDISGKRYCDLISRLAVDYHRNVST